MRETRYYSDFTDDFEESADQEYTLPADYRFVREDGGSKLLSGLVYGLAVVFGGLYCRCVLHMRVKGRRALRGLGGDVFIFGNHTQPVGDVFIPALCVLPRRIYTVVSPANYGIPIIGKLLPFLGALPLIPSLHGMKELHAAMAHRLEHGHPIVIYPEAHVWEYYTDIRPFPDTAFKYPVKFQKPTLAMTVTYRRSRLWKRPVMEVFLDGPFYPHGETVKEKTADLHRQVYAAMQKRSENSNYEYIVYKKK